MKQTSTPNGGSSVDDQLRKRRQVQAEIQEQVLLRALQRFEKHVLASARRSSDGLTTLFEDTERTLSDTASGMVEDTNRKLNRLRRRSWQPWLPFLLGAALVLAVQAAAFNWNWQLIRTQLENLALNRTGWAVRAHPDGDRWLRLPAGTEFLDLDLPAGQGWGRMEAPIHFLIPEG